MNGDKIETDSREKQLLATNPTNFNIDIELYKSCLLDFIKGIGPFGSPFAFLSYGISYSEMVQFAKFSIEFTDFIFLFLTSNEKQSVKDKSVNFLLESGLSLLEIHERLTEKFLEVQ